MKANLASAFPEVFDENQQNSSNFEESENVERQTTRTIFYPKNNSHSTEVILHQIKVGKQDNFEDKIDEAIWEMLEDGVIVKTLPEISNLQYTTHVIIRALVFYQDLTTLRCVCKAGQYKFTTEDTRQLFGDGLLFNQFRKTQRQSTEKEIKNEFLNRMNFFSIQKLFESRSLWHTPKEGSSPSQSKAFEPALMQ